MAPFEAVRTWRTVLRTRRLSVSTCRLGIQMPRAFTPPLTDEEKEAERQDRLKKFEEMKAIAADLPQNKAAADANH